MALVGGKAHAVGVHGIGWKVLVFSHLPQAGSHSGKGDPASQGGVHMGEQQSVGMGHGGGVGVSTTADKQLTGTASTCEMQCLSHAGDPLPAGWGVVCFMCEHQRAVIFKPAQHLLIRAAAQQQPLTACGCTKVLLIAWQTPRDSGASGDESVSGDDGDEGQQRVRAQSVDGGFTFAQQAHSLL